LTVEGALAAPSRNTYLFDYPALSIQGSMVPDPQSSARAVNQTVNCSDARGRYVACAGVDMSTEVEQRVGTLAKAPDAG
jgi:hypothetical protein